MLTDVPAQLLALLGTEAAMAPVLVGQAFLPAILHVLVPPEFALLLPLDAPGRIAPPWLRLGWRNRDQRHENGREESRRVHALILPSLARPGFFWLAMLVVVFFIVNVPARPVKVAS